MPHDDEHELTRMYREAPMEEEERSDGPATEWEHGRRQHHENDRLHEADNGTTAYESKLNRRTLSKLDAILLPFLSLLFLLNSLDKSNIGNAETAGFTHDVGLSASDLNISLAFFFAFFVALQPVGAAFGRRYGMARWVPACMSLWGLCTILHIWVRSRWQLIVLRVAIASLEAGFYPTTVSYLSLFYTRYEFAVRLGFFYGQTAVAGALGGVLSWAVFSHFPKPPNGPQLPPSEGGSSVDAVTQGGWKSWEVLFLIEGCTTICVALLGFIWLPHSADTAWFFNAQQRLWAEERIKRDRDTTDDNRKRRPSKMFNPVSTDDEDTVGRPSNFRADDDEEVQGEAHHRLLSDSEPIKRRMSTMSTVSVTADSGLNRHDVISAFLNYKIWFLLVCNILSAIPATAFSVFLPLVIKQLSPSLNLSAAASNLLSAPPFVCGAIVHFAFTRWSDHRKERLLPILWGLASLLIGLTLTVMSPVSNYVLRYISLCVLLGGSYIASPLTVSWLANNTPEQGKRAILLGINGWGNLAGVFSALLFTPKDAESGYVKPFIITLLCVLASFVGFVAFRMLLIRENKWRGKIVAQWTQEQRDREDLLGDADSVPTTIDQHLSRILRLESFLMSIGYDGVRRGDEKLTFKYGL